MYHVEEKNRRHRARQANLRLRSMASTVLVAGVALLVGLLFNNLYHEPPNVQPGQLALRFLVSDIGRLALAAWDFVFASLALMLEMIHGPDLPLFETIGEPSVKLYSVWQSVQCSQFLCYTLNLPSSGGALLPYSCAPILDPDQRSGYSPVYYRMGLAMLPLLLYCAGTVLDRTYRKEIRQAARKSEIRADNSRAYWQLELSKAKTEYEKLIAASNEQLRLAQEAAQSEKEYRPLDG
jgi:hypothetical protein